MAWRFLRRRAEAKAGNDLAALVEQFMAGSEVKSGVPVTNETALQCTTVLAASRVLSEGFAQLPPRTYREADDYSKTPVRNHHVQKLIARRPNGWMTSFEFRETLTMHAALTGNGYAYIGRIDGEPRELIPMLPGCVQVEQNNDYELTYNVSDVHGTFARLPQSSVLHLRGPSWDGFRGMPAVRLAREAIGLALATEDTHARLHANSARPGGIISVEGSLGEEAKKKLREAWNASNARSNAFKTAVLDQGAKWYPMLMSGVDAQHLETRRFQIEEICRAMRVFPQMVGYADKTATYASAEQFFIAHVVHSLMPWIVRWEGVIDRDLLDADGDLVMRFIVKGLLRGALVDRSTYYSKALGAGGTAAWMTQDEVRADDDLPPMGGAAAVLARPTNVAPGGAAQP